VNDAEALGSAAFRPSLRTGTLSCFYSSVLHSLTFVDYVHFLCYF
jgi:hypothetical protein